MRIGAIIIVMILMSCFSGNASADVRHENSEASDYMRRYARCMLTFSHRESVDLVTSMIDIEDFSKRFPQLVLRDAVIEVPICQPALIIRLGVKVNFDGDPLRFALAESLIERDWSGAELVSFAETPALPKLDVEPKAQFEARLALVSSNVKRTRLRARYERSLAMTWLAQYGECIVRHEPAASRMWVLAALNNRDEAPAISGLKSAFGECLAVGEALKFNKDMLRGMVAVSYVRLASFSQPLQFKAVR